MKHGLKMHGNTLEALILGQNDLDEETGIVYIPTDQLLMIFMVEIELGKIYLLIHYWL